MTSKYFLKKALRTNPNSEQFYLDQDILKSPESVQKYINWLHERACYYESIIQEKNKIIESKHKEIKRLNLCLLKRFFTIKNLKKLLNSSDDFFKGFSIQKTNEVQNTKSLGYQILDTSKPLTEEDIRRIEDSEKAFDEEVADNQKAGLYD